MRRDLSGKLSIVAIARREGHGGEMHSGGGMERRRAEGEASLLGGRVRRKGHTGG